tara:strand:+ start:366 stop:788 length:423 start_codon:yes stop_codon:yes gene_type:complete
LIKKNNNKLTSDQKAWKEFLEDPSYLFDKEELEKNNNEKSKKFKFDFHGYSIENANIKVKEIINQCYDKGVSEILIITGKGTHSNTEKNVYVSKDFSKLQFTIPEFINGDSNLSSKIVKIKRADQKSGGDGALIIKLKKL